MPEYFHTGGVIGQKDFKILGFKLLVQSERDQHTHKIEGYARELRVWTDPSWCCLEIEL